MRTQAVVLVLVAGLLAGCGDPGSSGSGAPAPQPPQPPEVVVRGRIEALFQAVRQDDVQALLPFVAREGEGDDRRYVAVTATDSELKELARVRSRVAKHVAAGTAHFDRFETQENRGQSWLAWHLVFGEGEAAVKAIYALVEVDGTWLLGDVD